MTTPVTLRVYFESEHQKSVSHVGVEVYGKEYYYCATQTDETGINVDRPRSHKELELVELGVTIKTNLEIRNWTLENEGQWKGADYNVFTKNSVRFAEAMAGFLGVERKVASAVTHAESNRQDKLADAMTSADASPEPPPDGPIASVLRQSERCQKCCKNCPGVVAGLAVGGLVVYGVAGIFGLGAGLCVLAVAGMSGMKTCCDEDEDDEVCLSTRWLKS